MVTATVLEPSTPVRVALTDDEALYEIINGQRVELPPMSAFAGIIAFELVRYLSNFVHGQGLGQAVCEVLFRLPLNGGRQRRPDGAYVSFQRWPQNRPYAEDDNAWDVVPDLAIEVISPTDPAEDLLEKIEQYFQAGVRLVWVVYPRRRIVHVYESLASIRGLRRSDELDGGTVVPGFRLPLATLFPEEPGASDHNGPPTAAP